MGDEQINELYLTLAPTVVLKLRKKRLYVPLDFEKNLTKDTKTSAVYVRTIALKDMDRIKQQATNRNLKLNDPPNFRRPVLNGQ